MNTEQQPRALILIAVLLSLTGVAVAGILLQHHVAVHVGGDPLLGGVCEAGAGASCDEVLSSEWGKVLGQPNAMWGFLFFAAASAWFIVVGQPTGERRWMRLLPLLASAAGLGWCAFLAFIMYARLPKWCPLCALTHALTLLLFVLSIVLWRCGRRAAATPDSTPSADPCVRSSNPGFAQLLVVLLLGVSMSSAAWAEYHRRVEKRLAETYKEKWQDYETDYEAVYFNFTAPTNPEVKIPILADDSIRGKIDAPHTVVVFSDFQCQFCRGVDQLLREKLEKFPNDLRIIYKHFPMNRECNAHVQGETHAAACAAAVSAEAARLAGGDETFWKMHDLLFENPSGFAKRARDYLREGCGKIGITNDELWKRINSTKAWERIHRHVAEAHALGINSTPVVFLDGRRVSGWANSRFWDFVIWRDKKARATTQPTTAPSRTPSPPRRATTMPATRPAEAPTPVSR